MDKRVFSTQAKLQSLAGNHYVTPVGRCSERSQKGYQLSAMLHCTSAKLQAAGASICLGMSRVSFLWSFPPPSRAHNLPAIQGLSFKCTSDTKVKTLDFKFVKLYTGLREVVHKKTLSTARVRTTRSLFLRRFLFWSGKTFVAILDPCGFSLPPLLCISCSIASSSTSLKFLGSICTMLLSAVAQNTTSGFEQCLFSHVVRCNGTGTAYVEFARVQEARILVVVCAS